MTDLPEHTCPPATYIPDLPAAERRKRVVIVANAFRAPLEFIGPLDVFQVANEILEISGRPDMGYDIEFVSAAVGPLFELPGLEIKASRSFEQLKGNVDTLVIAPMEFSDLFDGQETFLEWVAEQSKKVRRLVSICSGAYVLAAAGLLEGRRVSTHWDIVADFKARYPGVLIDPEPIYSKDDHIYTSAGLTAGIDLSISLVEEDFGRAVALRTAQAMVLFLKRPGSQAQFSAHLSNDFAESSDFAKLRSYIYAHLTADLRIEKLAERVNMSPRNFSRLFSKEFGVSPGKFVEQCRVEIARQKLEQVTLSIAQVATDCGYGSVDAMRLAFERHLAITPSAYRARFQTSNR